MQSDAVLLVGHGGVPHDLPVEWLQELRRLETARRRSGAPVSERELELDHRIRHFPRTDVSDPYGAGLRRLARSLEPKLEGRSLALAYNEFCTPSIEEAMHGLVQAGAQRVWVLSTMLTPGGHHSEVEIPESCERCRQRFVGVDIEYLWPFDLDRVAAFLADRLPPRSR